MEIGIYRWWLNTWLNFGWRIKNLNEIFFQQIPLSFDLSLNDNFRGQVEMLLLKYLTILSQLASGNKIEFKTFESR